MGLNFCQISKSLLAREGLKFSGDVGVAVGEGNGGHCSGVERG